MKRWPAIDAVSTDAELLLAELDDFSPTAVEDLENVTRIFFSSPDDRNRALAHLAVARVPACAIDVPDDDWARRSQETITPITVGRLVVTPPWHARPGLAIRPDPAVPAHTAPPPLQVVIQPSMGFGTGHHATTRLCLAALQAIDLTGAEVLDVGTGSGVLAIAAWALGARRARGIDNDPDAIQSAVENRDLNRAGADVTFALGDLSGGIGDAVADVVIANLTGALLVRAAGQLIAAARPGAAIVLSGLTADERPAVESAFSGVRFINTWQEDEWAALAFRR